MAGREGREGAVIADNFRVDLLECVDQGQHYLIVKAIDCSFHEAKFNDRGPSCRSRAFNSNLYSGKCRRQPA